MPQIPELKDVTAGGLTTGHEVPVHLDGAANTERATLTELAAAAINLAVKRDVGNPPVGNDLVGTLRVIGTDSDGLPILEFACNSVIDLTPALAVVSTNPPVNGLMTPEDKLNLDSQSGNFTIDGGRADSVYTPHQVIDGGPA